LRKLVPEKMFLLGIVTLALGVLITLAGVQYRNVGVMLFGTVVGGIGFGTVFSGALRSVLPYAQPGERAGLLSAYFVEGYLSFTMESASDWNRSHSSLVSLYDLKVKTFIYFSALVTARTRPTCRPWFE